MSLKISGGFWHTQLMDQNIISNQGDGGEKLESKILSTEMQEVR